MPELIPPDTNFGRYTIIEQIGVGGMGQVYRAKDNSELNRMVAIKILPTDLAADPKWMRRFIREARTVSGLNHPNVLTIYEFGQVAATRFIAMEYVDGITLRELMATQSLNLHEVLEIAMQVAAALDAAHEAHVIHRDIKPENIMVRRRDRIVKILDFGLAKPVAPRRGDMPSGGSLGRSLAPVLTEPGIVMGTVNYMSPEQSMGLQGLDYRTDIWSLGVVLYEMLTGQLPFNGKDVYEQVVAIQDEQQPPLSRFAEHVPEQLEQTVSKALAKNPDDRYQTSNALLIDLRNLKRKLEVDAEHDRAALFDRRDATTIGPGVTHRAGSFSSTQSTQHPVSSAEYIVNQVKSHRRTVLAILGAVAIIVALSLVSYFRHNRVALLTDKDTILLTEFDNKTGEDVFDGTLKQGLAVQLQQSPFLDIFPDQRVRATLQLMSLSPDERVTSDRAREICQRQGLKAYITGTIVKFDRNYSITLEAHNGQNGDQLALVQVEAEGKDQVLKALSQGATELREKLGEELSSIQKFDAKLEVTTSSLEALKEYALGRNEQDKGRSFKAIEFYKRATEIDPNFAVAWLGLGLQYSNTGQQGMASESLTKAFNLVERVSETERSRIVHFYYQIVTGELERAIEVQEEYVHNYPREARGPGNLGNLYSIAGQSEKAVAATSEALRLNPNTTIWPGNLAESLIQLNRIAEAKQVCEQALAQKLDSTSIRERLYVIAFINGDSQGMQDQVTWANGRPDEYRAVYWQTQAAAFGGEWKNSEELLKTATELAFRAEAREVAASYTADQAVRAAWLGKSGEAITLAEGALKIERTRRVLRGAAFAFAYAGKAAMAQSLAIEMEAKFPKDTLLNKLWLPQIRAAVELSKGNGQAALEQLELAKQYEPAGELRSQILRSMIYLRLNKSADAAAEARRIIDHRGEGPLSLVWALAHLQLARSSVMAGDSTQARKSYEDFLALWKNADKDLQPLLEAQKEYDRLK